MNSSSPPEEELKTSLTPSPLGNVNLSPPPVEPESEKIMINGDGDREKNQNPLPAENTPRSDEEKQQEPQGTPEVEHKPEYLTGLRLTMLSSAFAIANFMVAIDGSILATAIPRITSDFNSLDNIGWYGSSYLLTQMSLQPTLGRVCIYFEAKTTFILSLLLFECASIICAAAPNSPVFILGRCVAGAAAAGMLMGNMAIFGQVVPLRNRPRGMALMTSLFSVAGLLGPTVGGVITDSRLTWRFCFWINLPFGVLSALIIMYILDRKPGKLKSLPLKEKLARLDLLGATLLTSSLVTLFLALQWGGSTAPWSSPRVWGCLLVFSVLASAFVGLQVYKKERATIPSRILYQRTVAVCCIFSCLYGIAVTTQSYLLPLWFQGVRGTNATMSGVNGLPFTIASTICVLITGFTSTAFGYNVPFMWGGSLIYLAGAALLSTLQPWSDAGRYIGYQILAGVGFGSSIQVTFIAVQVVTPAVDMPTVCGMEVFFRQLGGAVGISAAQSIFLSTLTNRLESIPGVDAEAVIQAGIIQGSWSPGTVPSIALGLVKDALNAAIMKALILPVATAGLAAVVSWGMEWRRIPGANEEQTGAPVQETKGTTSS